MLWRAKHNPPLYDMAYQLFRGKLQEDVFLRNPVMCVCSDGYLE